MSVTQEEFRQLDLEIDEIRKAFESLKKPFQTISQIIHTIEKDFGQAAYFVSQANKEIEEKGADCDGIFYPKLACKMARQKLEALLSEVSEEGQVDFKLKQLRTKISKQVVELDKQLRTLEIKYNSEAKPEMEVYG